MRRKVLVLLLTLTLVLSFMPMIAFADTEAEGTEPVKKTVEAEKVEAEEPAQDNVEAEEAEEPADVTAVGEESAEETSEQIVTGKALNALDEDPEPEECKHENTYTENEVDWDNPTYVEIEGDNRFHKEIYSEYKVTYCEDCGEEWRSSEPVDTVEEIDGHHYDGNKCVCGHINTCTHGELWTYKDWDYDDENVKCTPIDNKYHRVTGPGAEVTVCELCGIEKSRKDTQIDEKEEHEYENGKCIYCEHENDCAHKNTKTDEEWDWGNEETKFEYTDTGDNRYHKMKGPVNLITWCRDCGETVSVVKSVKEKEISHDYDSNHVCLTCDHKNTCKHEHTDTGFNWEDDVEYKAVDNRYHMVTGPGERVTWCMDCDEEFKHEKVDNVNVKEPHDYDSHHECMECGHKNTCTHPSTFIDYGYDKDECDIVDTKDGSHHKVTGYITEYTYCGECDEELKERELGETTVTEEHYYNEDDECWACGYKRASTGDNARIFGKARYDTAIAVAEKYKGASGKFENVIVAYGQNFPDALSGGYLAKVKNAPILLVELAEEARIVDYISKNIASGGKVYLLGGTGVVSSAFESKVKAKGIATERLGGSSRYETNLAILKAAGVKDEDILVCTGAGYADSLSASAVGKPILLVDNTLSDAQKTYIKGLSSKQCYLIGGTGAVKPAIEKGLKDLGLKTERLAGSSRYETSTAVAKKFFAKAATVVLAYAQNFPDGLSGGPLAMMESAPIVLTDSKTTAAAQAYVRSAGVVKSITLGGPALISDIAVRAIMGR